MESNLLKMVRFLFIFVIIVHSCLLYTSSQTPSLSFEVFPPNPAVGNEKILRALEDMQGLAPHFISVTASNNKYNIKETTVPLADHIQNDLAIPTIAHLPAIYLSKEKVDVYKRQAIRSATI